MRGPRSARGAACASAQRRARDPARTGSSRSSWPSSSAGSKAHKFYLGKVAQGVIYLLFSWTGIPGLIAWIEAIVYLTTSDKSSRAATHGGPPRRIGGLAIGCLWLLALLPLLSIVAIIALIFMGNQVSAIMSSVGTSI